jgi:CheY-like chemotaxis protein
MMVAKILIIDDEPSVGRAMTRALRGYETSTETNACCAIRRIASDERFDLILCDLEMQEIGGKEIFDAVQRRPSTNRPGMLMMSGCGNVSALYATGCPVLLKPFADSELRTLVSAILGARTKSRSTEPEIPARRA